MVAAQEAISCFVVVPPPPTDIKTPPSGQLDVNSNFLKMVLPHCRIALLVSSCIFIDVFFFKNKDIAFLVRNIQEKYE